MTSLAAEARLVQELPFKIIILVALLISHKLDLISPVLVARLIRLASLIISILRILSGTVFGRSHEFRWRI
jgi:hypothetical protein